MPIRLFNPSGGFIDLNAGGTSAAANTFTLPAETGTLLTTASVGGVSQSMLAAGVAGNGPAFSASRTGADQSISSATWTKAQFNNEIFDTASCYDPTTNYRFTPNVAGYYLFMMNPLVGVTGSFTNLYIQFYINGAGNNQYTFMIPSGSSVSPTLQTIIYMNGTTDYVEAYIYITGTSPVHFSGGGVFNGVLVRTA